jgi:hypothetical protein
MNRLMINTNAMAVRQVSDLAPQIVTPLARLEKLKGVFLIR